MTKRIAIIIRNAYQHDFGGGERFPVFLAEEVAKHGFHSVVVSRSKKLVKFAESKRLTTVKGWWWSRQNWSGKRALLSPIYFLWQIVLFFYYVQLFVRLRPAVVHAQSKDDFIAATFAGRLAGARVIWTDHADLKHVWQNIGVWYKNPIGKLVHFAARFAHAITLVSKSEQSFVAAHLKNDDPVAKKLTVVYNGAFDVLANYTAPKRKKFTFVAASRLVTDKGIGELITAFSGIKSPAQLLLLGDGPEAEKFKQQAGDNKDIIFAGHQNDPFSAIATSHVFVHPTYHEGFSVALVEATMLSMPIIATSVGGNVEIIKDGETGLLVPAKDSSALQEAMERLAKDATLRDTLGQNARKQFVSKFDFTHIVAHDFIPLYKGEA